MSIENGGSFPLDAHPELVPDAQSADELARSSGYSDVEAFLGQYGETFSLIHELWTDVRAAKDAYSEVISVAHAPHRLVNEEGQPVLQWREVQPGEGRARRRKAERRAPSTKVLVAMVNQTAWDYIGDNLFLLDEALAKGVVEGRTTLAMLADIAVEAFNRGQTDVANPASLILPEHLDSTKKTLQDAYIRAFVAQYFGIKRIQELLAHDANVLPLIELIQEIAPLAQQGTCEFPGLLETLATHAQNDLREALHRVLPQSVYTKEAFIAALMHDGIDTMSIKTTDLPKTFIGGVAASQVLAQAVSLEVRTEQTRVSSIVQYLTRHFDSLPAEWGEIYVSDTRVKVTQTWRTLHALLAPFVRSGRLRSNIRTDDNSQQGKSSTPKVKTGGAKNAAKRRNIGRGQSEQDANLDVEDVSMGMPETEPITMFSVLKGIGGSDTHFALEQVGGIDNLMQHDIVRDFLKTYRGEPGLEDSLRGFLAYIASDPFNRENVKPILRRRYSIQVAGNRSSSPKYRLRRFSPRQGPGGGPTGSALIGRVRILFGVAALQEERHILLDSIVLRNEATF